jgi:hypothetical protein
MFTGGKLKLKNAKLLKQPTSNVNVKKTAKDILSSLTGATPSIGEDEAESNIEEIWTEQSKTQGDGKVVSSSTTITGFGTHFKSQVEIGDAIELIPSEKEQDEADEPQLRLVKFVLSDTSLGINSPFEPDQSNRSDYFILKLPKQVITQERREADAKKRKREEEAQALGEFANGIKKVDTSSSKSREDLLFERMKKKGDKFC